MYKHCYHCCCLLTVVAVVVAVAVCRADQCLGESAATTAKHDFSRSWSRPVISSSIQHRPSISSNVEVSLHRHLHSVSAIRGGGGGRQHGRQKKAAVDDDDDDDDGGKASMLSSIFNLVNNVAGAGILTLPAGMASGTGWIPAMAICAALGAISCHTFAIIGDACEMTGQQDFKGLWKKTISPESTYVVDVAIAIMCLACSIIYSGILGDVFTQLLAQAGLPAQFNGRTSNILAITATVLLPLSLIKDLSALAFTSILGFLSIAYTVFFICVRALDGTYNVPGGKFLHDGFVPLVPTFERTSLMNVDFTSLVLASNLGLAYIAHYNAPAFYRSLKNTSSNRFGLMVSLSFTILILMYIATMVAGYSTFGDVCSGNILLNYHPQDFLSTLGRLATGFSILFGFPLVAAGARESIIGVASSMGKDAIGSDKNHCLLVAGILVFVTSIACTVKDVSLVVGLTGAALGSFIVYMIPPVIYTKAVALSKGSNSPESKNAKINLLLVPFGICIAFLGCFITIKESMAK